MNLSNPLNGLVESGKLEPEKPRKFMVKTNPLNLQGRFGTSHKLVCIPDIRGPKIWSLRALGCSKLDVPDLKQDMKIMFMVQWCWELYNIIYISYIYIIIITIKYN